MKKCLVLGGTNIDIMGYSYNPIVKNDSNPGSVGFSYGGVGRNIAVNMKQMGLDVRMITAFGNDSFKDLLVNDFKSYDIEVSHSVFSDKYPSSVYLCVLDDDKELDLAINSMEVINEIDNQEFLESKLPYINEHDFVLIDGNLSEEAIKYLVHHIDAKIVVDGVSSIKVVKFKEVLGFIDTLKINTLEAQALTQVSITDEGSLLRAGQALVKKGVKNVFITDGANGSYVFDQSSHYKFGIKVDGIVNVTGAGDTFTAGVVYGLSQNFSNEETLKFSSMAAKYTLQSAKTISEELNVLEILKQINK